MSKIEWTDVSWNPVTGCKAVSPGCDNCYAERTAFRLQAMGKPKYARGFEVVEHPEALDQPHRWRKGKKIFVNSMSDLFEPRVSFDFIDQVVEVIAATPRHTYQVLTKRPKTAALWARHKFLPDNLWLGVSVESHEYRDRIEVLRGIQAFVRFVSVEPLLDEPGDLGLKEGGVKWVIVGGESGPGARPMHPDWARNVREQCLTNDVAFFFKQWGGTNKKKTGRELDGKLWEQFPQT